MACPGIFPNWEGYLMTGYPFIVIDNIVGMIVCMYVCMSIRPRHTTHILYSSKFKMCRMTLKSKNYIDCVGICSTALTDISFRLF